MVCVFIPENTAAALSEKLSFAIAIQIALEHLSQGFQNRQPILKSCRNINAARMSQLLQPFANL